MSIFADFEPKTSGRYPSCCGSEDGEVIVGVDPAERGQYAVVTIWACHTCGVFTIVDAESAS